MNGQRATGIIDSGLRVAGGRGRRVVILVIGSTGTVGSEVVSQLVGRGHRPRALVRDRRKASRWLGDHVDVVVGELDSAEALGAALSGVDRVFLLSRQGSRQPEQERGVVLAAVRACVRHVVKLSVFRADEASPLQIARQHRQAERTLIESGLAYTIVRPPFFMQNLSGMVRDGGIYTATEDGRVAMIDVRDIAAVVVAALTNSKHEGETYTPTGSEAVTFDEVAAILSERSGAQIRHVRVPPEAVRNALQAAGLPDWFAADMAKLHTMLASGYEDVVTDDVYTAAGIAPRTLAQFAGDFAAAFTGHQQER
jgi:uncharacterized protein YbjT (DUF2867 family)